MNIFLLIFLVNLSLVSIFTNIYVDFFLLISLLPFSLLYFLFETKNNSLHSIIRIIFSLFAITLFLSFIFIKIVLVKVLLFGIILVGVLIIFKTRKTKMLKICTECEFKADFEHCPGYQKMRSLAENIRTDVLIPLNLE